MKLKEIYTELFESDREKGAPLSSKTSNPYITIYRAVPEGTTEFKDMDYVTLSRKFAVEHAENNTVVNDDLHIVIKAMVSTSDVYDATNPGEYFYSGKPERGKLIYTSKGYEYDGYDELTKADFVDKRLK
tara:strand:- start:2650 stop:3039 length:390 start_codon:yes stop_codon:yes gene_type:complete